MKKKYLFLSFILIIIFSSIFFLNFNVTSKQGRDYEVSTLNLPLYLKALNFYHRHFSYAWLTKKITGHLKTKEEKVFRLFQWTHETIRPQPEGLFAMDDHPWNVYIRGYGTADNFHDLFSTLCNYAGVDGFSHIFLNKEGRQHISLSFVKIARGWVVFDPYHGIYFTNKSGEWATVDEIKKNNWKLMHSGFSSIQSSYYEPILNQLADVNYNDLKRANIQSPINRLKFQFQKWLSGERPLLE